MHRTFLVGRHVGPCLPGALLVLALLAGWLVAALLCALLAEPALTLTTLDRRGARGVPAVMWTGSREIVEWLHDVREGFRHE